MLNRLFFSKKAHRILTALFLLSMFAYGNIIDMAATGTYTEADTLSAGLGLIVACYYDMFYLVYFVIRFIWRLFNRPDEPSEYEKDKARGMSQNDLMDKYGVYRY